MYKNNKSATLSSSISFTALAIAMPAFAQNGLEEVFVTARKRDEGAQAVPLSMSALSAEALEQRNVREVQDLNTVVPGFRFGGEGGKTNNNIMMRGLSKIPLGDGMPAVVTYFANVAQPAAGGNIPTYDIANIQVLKGPQGTLFGRNALGGAVVITPEAPNYDWSGYVRGGYGTKDLRTLEGAVNVPLIDNKLALRIAGQMRRQDGLTKNLSGGPDFDDIHQNSYRLSILWEPFDNVHNTLVWDNFNAAEKPSGLSLFRINSSSFNPLIGAFGTSWATQVQSYVNGAQANFHSAYTDMADAGFANRRAKGLSNDTSIDMDFATLRNIFGWRQHDVETIIDTTATGPIALPRGATTYPFIFYHAYSKLSRKYISDELQLFGTAYDDKLDWITGLYYNNDHSAQPNGSQTDRFRYVGLSALPSYTTSNVENTNKAVFAQFGLDISDWTVDGLKATAGIRKSWDEVEACGGGNPDHLMSPSECRLIAERDLPDGTGILKNKGSEKSWTLGLDWQITPDTLLYVTHRRSYRGVNVNTPAFETAFTTGGTGCNVSGVAVTCPDLRPFQTVDPEILTDWEIGAKNDWFVGDVKGRINVAAFISKYKGAVQFINGANLGIPSAAPDLPTNSSVGVNAADITIKGVETELTVVPIPSLTLTLATSFIDQDIDKVTSPSANLALSEKEITLPSADFSGTFAFSWILPVTPMDGELIFNGDYYKTTPFSGQGGENLPGYTLANFRLNWNRIAKSGLDIAVYVKNAFDEEYLASPTVLLERFPVSTAMQGDPRTWGVEATYRW
ncbi:MAG: TonB-dependent receptor [Verrucomicrobiaceae bacterium]|nr:TonB-dependent receptor [Verrucomicrobiaceae bacterium]